jgi:hypothetical protein
LQGIPDDLQSLLTEIGTKSRTENRNVFELPGEIGIFIGDVERLNYAIALRGDKGAGKTRFLYQLKNAFASKGLRVASFSLEIDKGSELVTRMKEDYISPKNKERIFISSEAPEGINTIRKAAQHFDVVAIDSWGKLNVGQEEVDKLRKEFPTTLFLIIFQSTVKGTARGGSAAEYDASVVIHIANGGNAVCEKNRYNGDHHTYNVFQQKILAEEI